MLRRRWLRALSSLDELAALWVGCTDCALHETRTTVVVGSGNPDAEIMFVGEAPGLHEDRSGVPFVGQAGKLLDELLETIGLARGNCYIANVIKCRPPSNRDPQPGEIEACQGKLFQQIELVKPKVICTLGNFATKLLSGRDFGVTRVHGKARRALLGPQDVVLYPLYHPAAALYNVRLRPELEADLARLPELLAVLRKGDTFASLELADVPAIAAASAVVVPDEPEQLGLF